MARFYLLLLRFGLPNAVFWFILPIIGYDGLRHYWLEILISLSVSLLAIWLLMWMYYRFIRKQHSCFHHRFVKQDLFRLLVGYGFIFFMIFLLVGMILQNVPPKEITQFIIISGLSLILSYNGSVCLYKRLIKNKS